jgi:hypothetical protein
MGSLAVPQRSLRELGQAQPPDFWRRRALEGLTPISLFRTVCTHFSRFRNESDLWARAGPRATAAHSG